MVKMLNEKASAVFSRIMLSVFLCITVLSLLVMIPSFLQMGSYTAALAAAVILFVGFLLVYRKKKPSFDRILKLGTVRLCVILSVLCFVVKFAWTCILRIEPTVDYLTFWNTAKNIAEGNSFDPVFVSVFPHILGYASFLSVFLRVFGSSLLVPPLVNVGLTVISGICIFTMLKRNSTLKAACIGYILWIVCPSCTFFNTMVLSEPYYTALILLFLTAADFTAERLFKDTKTSGMILRAFLFALAAAVILALANSARPIGIIPIIALFIWMVFLCAKRSENKKTFWVFLLSAVVLIVLYYLFGKIWKHYIDTLIGVETASFPGYSIYVGFDMESMGSFSTEDGNRVADLAYSYGAVEAQRIMLEDAKKMIFSGNIDFPRLLAAKLAKFLGNDEAGAYYSIEFVSGTVYSVCAVLSNVFYYFLLLCVIRKTILRIKKPGTSALLLCPLYCIGLTLAQMLVEVAGRYHYSIIPMLIIIASEELRKDNNLQPITS